MYLTNAESLSYSTVVRPHIRESVSRILREEFGSKFHRLFRQKNAILCDNWYRNDQFAEAALLYTPQEGPVSVVRTLPHCTLLASFYLRKLHRASGSRNRKVAPKCGLHLCLANTADSNINTYTHTHTHTKRTCFSYKLRIANN